jgi:carboxymethylenebutenolidase
MMRHQSLIALSFCWLFGSYGYAADIEHHPQAKDHPFNETLPQNLTGEAITLKTPDDVSFNAYVAGPENARAGILVVHEWWGLNDHIRAQADMLAKQGYRVLAIDLYDGKVTSDPKLAGTLMEAVQQNQANAKLRAALAALKAPDRKLATLGWCFGGGQALQATLTDPGAVSATVIYYGLPVTDVAVLKTLNGPVLGIFAQRDGWITPAMAADFEKAMLEAGKSLEAHHYAADHAFANPSSPNYNSVIAQEAWHTTQDFLAANLLK